MEEGASIRQSAAEIPAISSPRTDHLAADSASTGWTDERHSTFLSSMEASFVDELYTNQYMSKDLSSWLSRWMKNVQTIGFSRKDMSSDECKTRHIGCLNHLNLVRNTAKTHVDAVHDTVPIGSNPWIQRLRPIAPEAHTKPNMINSEFYNSKLSDQSERYSETTHPVHLTCPQVSAIALEEVSDQNFVGDELDTEEHRICKKRRL